MTAPDESEPVITDFSQVILDPAFIESIKAAGLADVPPLPDSAVSRIDTVSYGPSPHQALSKVVYDMVQLLELVNVNAPDGVVQGGHGEPVTTVGDIMAKLMVMIARAPLSSEYATRLAFGK